MAARPKQMLALVFLTCIAMAANANVPISLFNHQLPQSARNNKTPLQPMKQWHNLKPDLFSKQAYHLPGCDS